MDGCDEPSTGGRRIGDSASHVSVRYRRAVGVRSDQWLAAFIVRISQMKFGDEPNACHGAIWSTFTVTGDRRLFDLRGVGDPPVTFDISIHGEMWIGTSRQAVP